MPVARLNDAGRGAPQSGTRLMALWVRSFRLTRWLHGAIVLHMLAVLAAFLASQPSTVVDGHSIALILCLDLALILLLRTSPERAIGLTIIVVVFELLFFLPRLFGYVALPVESMNYPFPYVLDADSLNVGLLYVILGTVGFAAGAALAPSPPPQRAADSRGALPLSLPGFLLAWLAALGVSVFFFAKGVNSFDAAGPPVPFAWLVYFFNPDVAALLTLAIPLLFPQFLRRHRWIIAAFLVAYLVFGTLHGSRGTPLRLAMMAVLMLVAFRDDARLSIRDLSFALALLVPASLFTFVLGTGIRYVHMGLEADVAARQVLSDQKVTYTSGTVIAPGCVSSLHAEAEPGREPGSGSSHVLSGLTARVVARLGIVDYAVEIVSRPGDRNVLDHYMTVRYAVKNFANNLVIGTPYPESEIMTSRVIPMAYRGCNEAWVRSAVQTSPWTAWGLSYVLFGWWGGLAALGVAGYLVQLGVVGLRRWSGPAAGAFVGAFFFLFVYAAVLQTGGLDASATVSCYLMLATCVTVALAYSPLLLQRFRRRDG